jgi:UDP-N-acetyl-D-mannosaminuronic acid transferase (WecB/TagA/CpsF family)
MPVRFRQILGVKFYAGDLDGIFAAIASGGLVTAPSAPVLVDLETDPDHRRALEGCDFALTDSAFMVLLWLLLKRERLPRISGVRFVRALLARPEFRQPFAALWVMPSEAAANHDLGWLRRSGVPAGQVPAGQGDCYVAPKYPAGPLVDEALAALVEARRPRFVVICVGGGVQERLGFFLKSRLSYRPAILCTGAAIALVSGRQVRIPVWADRAFVGWIFRALSQRGAFTPRLRKALRLAPLLWRFGERSLSICQR